jgi:hypothetical protein
VNRPAGKLRLAPRANSACAEFRPVIESQAVRIHNEKEFAVRKRSCLTVAALTLGLALPATCQAGLITFDEPFVAGVLNNAPATFAETSPLTQLYAPMGVHFSGPDAFSGGAILNDGTGAGFADFGISAHSGSNFLAFNRNASYGGMPFMPPFFGGKASDPETISFDAPQSAVSIWAAGGWMPHNFQIQAFDAGNHLLATDTIITQGWSELSVSGSGITSVVLTETGGPWDSWVYDDLSFAGDGGPIGQPSGGPASAPEPAGLVLLGLGGLGLAGWRWRRRAA